jgi:hypothetical protein
VNTDAADPGAPQRYLRALVAAIVVAVAAVAVVLLWPDENSIRLVRGEVDLVGADGVGVGVDGEGYLVGAGRAWRGVDGAWHESGQPECLPPGSRGAVVELGVLPIPSEHDAGGYPNNVAWVRCVSLPSETGLTAEIDPPALDLAYREALEQAEG